MWNALLQRKEMRQENGSCNFTSVQSFHCVIGQIVRTMLHGFAVRTKAKLEAAFNCAHAVADCAMCCASDISLQGNAPGTLAFGRDVNVNVPVLTDIVAISVN